MCSPFVYSKTNIEDAVKAALAEQEEENVRLKSFMKAEDVNEYNALRAEMEEDRLQIATLKKALVIGVLKDHDACVIYQDEEYTKLEVKYYALTAERDKLREALSLMIGFIPDKWDVPLGYNQVVAQAQEALRGGEEGQIAALIADLRIANGGIGTLDELMERRDRVIEVQAEQIATLKDESEKPICLCVNYTDDFSSVEIGVCDEDGDEMDREVKADAVLRIIEKLRKQIATLKAELDKIKNMDRKDLASGYRMYENLDRKNDQIATLTAENKRLREEAAKYKAFWEQSRMADKMRFEEYVWKTLGGDDEIRKTNQSFSDSLR